MRGLVLTIAVLAAACGGRSVTFTPPPSNAVRVFVDVGEEGGWTGQAVSAFRDEGSAGMPTSTRWASGQEPTTGWRSAIEQTRFEAGVEVTLYDGRGDDRPPGQADVAFARHGPGPRFHEPRGHR